MRKVETMTWNQLLQEARTGDLVVFHGEEWLAEIVQITGDFSHMGMIVRPDPDGAPLLWQESGIPIAKDPDREGSLHKGAQLGLLDEAIHKIETYRDYPYYRRLRYDRPPNWDARVQELISEMEGRPFPSLLKMAITWLEGHFLHKPSPNSEMFCSQLIALMYQSLGLLGTENPPNFYSPSSFAGENFPLLNSATFGDVFRLDMDGSR